MPGAQRRARLDRHLKLMFPIETIEASEAEDMRYQLTPIFTRPWLLNGLSLRLIESHYENHYGGALRRLNAITEQLESLDVAKAPAYVVNSLKREQLIALNSTLLHELYFASLAFGDGKPTDGLAGALSRDFGSVDRCRSEFVAMASGLAGGSGWVLLVYVPRDRRLINQSAGDHGQTVAGGIPILALDMYEHAYHIDFGANAKAYIETFQRNIDWPSVEVRYEDALQVAPPRPLVQKEFGDLPGVGVEEVKAMLDAGKPVQIIDARPRSYICGSRTSWTALSGATRSTSRSGSVSSRNRIRSSCSARTGSTSGARPPSRCARPASTRST